MSNLVKIKSKSKTKSKLVSINITKNVKAIKEMKTKT